MDLDNVDRTILLSVLDTWMELRDKEYQASTDDKITAGLIEAMSNMQRIIDKLEAQCAA